MEFFKHSKLIKCLFILFIVFSITHIIIATVVQRGIVVDGIWTFWDALSSDGLRVSTNYNERMRFFSSFIMQIPILTYLRCIDVPDKHFSLWLFSFPLFFLPFIIPFWNFYLIKRTKRIDICLLSFVIFAFGALFFEWYSIVEFFVSISLYWILFHYLSAKIEYSKFDIVCICLLCLFLYNSHEFIGCVGILFFVASFLYSNDSNLSKKTRFIKYFIGINGLLAATLFFVFCLTKVGPTLTAPGGLEDVLTFLNFFITSFYSHSLTSLLYTVYIYLAIYSLLMEKEYNNIQISLIFVSSIAFLSYILYKTSLNILFSFSDFVNVSIEDRFSGSLVFIFCFLLVIFNDFIFKPQKAKIQIIIKNLFIVSLIAGIVFSIYQIYWSYFYKNMTTLLLSYSKTRKSKVLNLSKSKRIARYFVTAYPPDYAPLVSLMISKKYAIGKIIAPFKVTSPNYNNLQADVLFYCYDSNNKEFHNYRADNYRYEIPIKNDYWNLSQIKTSLVKKNKTCKKQSK